MVMSLNWKAVTSGILCLGLELAGCSSCPGDDAPPQYVVTVVDSATQGSICDAAVFVDDSPTLPPENCRHVIPIPAGRDTVTLRAERAGYASDSKTVTTKYETDSCERVVPVRVEFRLEKTP